MNMTADFTEMAVFHTQKRQAIAACRFILSGLSVSGPREVSGVLSFA